MSDIVTATKTPWTIRALNQDYTLSPLRFRGWGALIRYIRQTVISTAMDGIAGSEMNREDRSVAIAQATKVANSISLAHAMPPDATDVELAKKDILDLDMEGLVAASESGDLRVAVDRLQTAVMTMITAQSDESKMLNAILMSPEGMLEVFWLSLKIHHKGITRDKAEEIAMSMDDELMDVCNRIIEESTSGSSPKARRTMEKGGEEGEGGETKAKN